MMLCASRACPIGPVQDYKWLDAQAIFAPGGKRQRADPYDATQGQIDKPRAASLDRILAIHARAL